MAAMYSVLVVVTTLLVFDVSLGKNVIAIAATTMTLSIVSLAFGLFISTLVRTEGQIMPTVPLVIVPSILLSGLIIPHARLGPVLRGISYSIPLTWAENVLLGLSRDGKDFGDVATAFAALLGCGLVLLTVASFTLREE